MLDNTDLKTLFKYLLIFQLSQIKESKTYQPFKEIRVDVIFQDSDTKENTAMISECIGGYFKTLGAKSLPINGSKELFIKDDLVVAMIKYTNYLSGKAVFVKGIVLESLVSELYASLEKLRDSTDKGVEQLVIYEYDETPPTNTPTMGSDESDQPRLDALTESLLKQLFD